MDSWSLCPSREAVCITVIDLQSFYWLYLFNSQRAENPISPALVVLTLCLKMLMAVQSAQVLQARSDAWKSLQTHAHTSRAQSLLISDLWPRFHKPNKNSPSSFLSPAAIFGMVCCAYNMQYATIIVVLCVTLTSSLDVLLSAVELSLLFCYILRILLKTQTQNSLLFTCSYLNSRHRKILL